jgi:hypothetical protein
MIFNNYRGFGAADAEVASWCASKFPHDPTMQAKCSVNTLPMSLSPPWTDLGAILRGIPKPGSLIVGLVGGGQGSPGYTPRAPPPSSSSGSGIFGIPSTIMLAGGAVLAIGVGAMVLSRRKRPAVAGYGNRRRRRKSRR